MQDLIEDLLERLLDQGHRGIEPVILRGIERIPGIQGMADGRQFRQGHEMRFQVVVFMQNLQKSRSISGLLQGLQDAVQLCLNVCQVGSGIGKVFECHEISLYCTETCGFVSEPEDMYRLTLV